MDFTRDVQTFLEQPDRTFAAVFMSGDPMQCAPVERARLAAALPLRRAQFDAAGVGPLRLIGGEDEILDDHYVLARTVWRGDLRDGGYLDLRSTFILRRTGDDFEVVFYLNHQDVPALLAARATSDGHHS